MTRNCLVQVKTVVSISQEASSILETDCDIHAILGSITKEIFQSLLIDLKEMVVAGI